MKPTIDYALIEPIYQELKDDPQWASKLTDRIARQLGVTDKLGYYDLKQKLRQYYKRRKVKETPGFVSITRREKLRTAHPFLAGQCEAHGLDIESVGLYWQKSNEASILTVIPKEEVARQSFLDSIRVIAEQVKTTPYTPVIIAGAKEEQLALIVSDMHVGLHPNPNRRAMYPVEYNADIFRANLAKVYAAAEHNVNMYGTVDLLTLNDLGDGLDGANKQTTRGGHILEQNMDNVAMFQTFVQEKLRLIENLVRSGMAKKYLINNVSNDNHAGDFAAIANTTIQMLIEQRYPPELVRFRVMHRFMEHFTYGQHTFILTHGKDQEYQFKGLPLTLNDRTEKFVRAYIDYHHITTPYIHVWKGDCHRLAYTSCLAFDYRNFTSFAPASQWCQHNFSGAESGFALERIPKNDPEIQHIPYRLSFEKSQAVQAEEWVF